MKKRFLALALTLSLCAGLFTSALAAEVDLFPASAEMPAFTDVSPDGKAGGVWYDYTSVKVCVEAGLMKGSNGGFQPGGQMTVAELAMVCARIHEKFSGMAVPEKGAGEVWYGPAIRVMDELGIETGADPLAKATRDDFARMLSAVCGADALKAVNSITALPDTESADVLRLYNAGILTGTDKYGTFAPTKGLSRAEAAAMLSRVVRPSLRKQFTPAERSASVDDLTALLVGMNGDDALLTVDGRVVPAKEYFYFLKSAVDGLGELFGSADNINWEMELGGQSVSEYLKAEALDRAVLYSVVEEEAKKAGVTLTAADTAELDAFHTYAVETLGSEEAYGRFLRQNCIDEAGLRHIQTVGQLYTNLEQRLYPAPNEQELAAYVEEAGILKAKHILVSDKAQAENILAQLKAAGNFEAKLDALAEQYSEDGRGSDGRLAAPGGYVFLSGEMVQEFEAAAKALKVGEVSGLVESEYGYHIILRLAVGADDVLSVQGGTVGELWSAKQMDALLGPKVAAAKVVINAACESLDTEAFYGLLAALDA